MGLIMQQLNIQYFWPLTEQIPLDLDYTDCIEKRLDSDIQGYIFSNAQYGKIEIGNGGSGGTTGYGNLVIDAPNVIWRTDKITWWKKMLFKVLDVRLEQR
jgi:hypothetical protein